MKRIPISAVVAFSATCLWVGMASATLVGDAVTIGHYSPDATTPLAGATPPGSPTVVAGNADLYHFYNSYPFGYDVDVEADSISVDYLMSGGTWPAEQQICEFNGAVLVCAPINFNGLAVSDLDDSSGNALAGVLVDTNMVGWDSSRLSFGADYVRFDWKGLSFDQDTYLHATLDFGAVPEPSTVLLLGSGLGGLAMLRNSTQARRRLTAE